MAFLVEGEEEVHSYQISSQVLLDKELQVACLEVAGVFPAKAE